MTQQQKKLVRAAVGQGEKLAAFLGSLSTAEFSAKVPGRRENVVDITAKLLVSQTTLLARLDQPTTQRPSPLPAFFIGAGISRQRDYGLAREIAAHETGAVLAEQFQENLAEIAARLADPAQPAVVIVDGSALRAGDLLRAVGLDWVTLADDLNRALPHRSPVAHPRDALADAVRVVAEIVRSRHPGRSVEVRIPPFAAVQCGTPGEPAHTRGTPPTVVECEPLPFLRLCRGRTTWADAHDQGQLSASGIRGDLSEWFPLC